MVLPVVNYGRMERLRLPERKYIPMNVNTFAIAFIILCIGALYRRYVIIRQERERFQILDNLLPVTHQDRVQFHTLDTSRQKGTDPSS